jgi:hypothetical protein
MFGGKLPSAYRIIPEIKELPKHCPKCNEQTFSGPTYIECKNKLDPKKGFVFYECLEYKCTHCAYIIDVATKDATRAI